MDRKKLFLCVSLTLIILTVISACSLHTPPAPTITETQSPSPTATIEFSPPTYTPTPEPTSTPGPQTYIVQEGDTLWDISQSFGLPSAFIALRNNLSDENQVYPGEILIIPEQTDTPPTIEEKTKLIVVVLSLQKLYAYEDGQPINEFLVSTGLSATPTPTGRFQIYLKYDSTRMTGPGYDLPDVKWTMYFYQDYGIHGAYWHNNFGHPMSHGCVNMRDEDAKWLYDWAPIGTNVLILS